MKTIQNSRSATTTIASDHLAFACSSNLPRSRFLAITSHTLLMWMRQRLWLNTIGM